MPDTPLGPSGWPFLGVLPNLIRNPLRFFQDAATRYGDVVQFEVVNRPLVLLSHPDHIRFVLQENHRNYGRSRFHEGLRPVLGQGLITSEGEAWQRDRENLQPFFARAYLIRMLPTLAGVVHDHITELEKSGAKVVELEAFFSELTLNAFCRSIFGPLSRAEIIDISRLLKILLRLGSPRIWFMPKWLAMLPIGGNLTLARAIKELDRIVAAIVERESSHAPNSNTILSDLCSVGGLDAPGARAKLRDQIVTLLFAGHETTAITLAWMFERLARNEESRVAVEAEARTIDIGTAPSSDELAKSRFITAAIRETMRLFPPVWRLTRRAIGADSIGDYSIKPDTTIVMCQYIVHRDARFWNHPNEFQPSRFLGDAGSGRHSHAYFPFGGGPRQCIGYHLAMIEMQLIVILLARQFRFLPMADEDPPIIKPYLTLRSSAGIRLRCERLSSV